jgi:hypothetical protein
MVHRWADQATSDNNLRPFSAGLSGLRRTLLSPERLSLAALSLSGTATVVSVALPAVQRGFLAACVVSATLGAALGSFSIDTFLLSRPSGWVLYRGARWILALLAGSLAVSAAAAAALTAVAGVGSYPVSVTGAMALTIFNASAALSLRRRQFGFVYSMRAAGGALLIVGYGALYLRADRDGIRWALLWLAAQCIVAAIVGAEVLRRALARRAAGPPEPEPEPPPGAAGTRRGDLAAMTRLHVGVCAQLLTFRLDQVLLARYAGAAPLGVYALAVSALEFAQAGAVVTAQRILADRSPRKGADRVGPVLRAALPVAVLAVLGLAALGVLVPGYRPAWPLGLLLLPGCMAVAVGKIWSANVLKQRGERATTVVALQTLAVAVPGYLMMIPFAGAAGAAVVSSVVYALHALWSRARLRDVPAHLATGVA